MNVREVVEEVETSRHFFAVIGQSGTKAGGSVRVNRGARAFHGTCGLVSPGGERREGLTFPACGGACYTVLAIPRGLGRPAALYRRSVAFLPGDLVNGRSVAPSLPGGR